MESSFSHRLCLIFIASLLLSSSHAVFASSLGDFERAATQQNTRVDNKDEEDSEECSDEIVCSIVSGIFNAIFSPLFSSSDESDSERSSRQYDYSEPQADTEHVPGSRDNPMLAADLSYQQAEDHVYGVESRAEAGIGLLGVQVKNLSYRQEEPSTSLSMTHIHLLLRQGFGIARVNAGLGTAMLDGSTHSSGSSWTLQMGVYPSEHVSVEGSYIGNAINGNSVDEYDGSIAFGSKQGYALRAGYKLNQAGGETIRGPYLGFSWRY